MDHLTVPAEQISAAPQAPVGDRECRAGFWVRLAAASIDLAVVYAAVRLAATVLAMADVYVPLELTILVVGMAYAFIQIAWRGTTLGKAACGLQVRCRKGGKVGWIRAGIRETLGKLIAAAPLALGFLWAGLPRMKRGWHDYLAGTVVVRNPASARRGRRVVTLVLLIDATLLTTWAYRPISVWWDIRHIDALADAATRYAHRDPASLIEVSSVSPADLPRYAAWLADRGTDPVDYAVRVAAAHQITIFGEEHHIQDNLEFLSRSIPDLYHRAGVSCLAMECCTAEDNDNLARLVTAARFDDRLALEIARHEGWQAWGDQEYWDVFYTVWKLNQTLTPGQPKMRVVGIDTQWDGPSFALMGVGGDSPPGPWWEKLRLVRLLDDFVLLGLRDQIMARNVEKEIVAKGQRGIVWVGLPHDMVNCRQAALSNGKVVSEWGRMGFMLRHKYGEQVFNIRLHAQASAAIGAVIERAVAQNQGRAVGFDLEGSPFEFLRDGSGQSFPRVAPNAGLADMASGYIFLKPADQLTRCHWQAGYISGEMLVRNKPYYETECGGKLSSADEANRLFARKHDYQPPKATPQPQ